ncbi:MAG: indolepyruvate oxidoreductase subunit beta [Candidatus Latescibacterota bacterium]
MSGNGTTSVLFAGVGGQGIVLASGILASACLEAGHDVKGSEVHGMAQRGGSVTSHVRFGPRVVSPTIPAGEADFVVGFELLESLRACDQLAPHGTVVANLQRIDPITVASGAAQYPAGLPERIRQRCERAVFVAALEIARQAGSVRAANMALLGCLSARLPLELDLWQRTIERRVPARTLPTNWEAFTRGRGV